MQLDKRKLSQLGIREAGFVPVEAIVAAALLASVITVAIAGVAVTASTAALSNKNNTAIMITHQQIESIKGQPYDASGTYNKITPPSGYKVSFEILSVVNPAGTPETGIQRIHVTVCRLQDQTDTGCTLQDQTVRQVDAYKVSR